MDSLLGQNVLGAMSSSLVAAVGLALVADVVANWIRSGSVSVIGITDFVVVSVFGGTIASVVVLAIKPQNASTVIEEIREHVREDAMIISVLAGVTTEGLQQSFGHHLPVVRTMPNTPMLVDEGASAIAGGRYTTEEHMSIARHMFEAVGKVEVVPEYLMDAVTGLSGSGPAYVYMFIEALTDAGVKQGLPRPTALRLSAQTVFGAAKLVLETGKHPAILRDEVTTPGGTAIAAVAELEEVARGLPGNEAIGELAALGFTTLVIHGLDESRPAVMRWLLELETRRGGPLELVRKTPHAAAFAILPAQ